jgi:hypothetical protein
MGEQSEDLAKHIDDQRNRLSENIDELEQKAKDAVDKAKDALDWRVQMEERPGTMLGLAFGAGILLSAILGGPRRRGPSWKSSQNRKSSKANGSTVNSLWDTERSTASSPFRQTLEATQQPDQSFREGNAASHTWDNIKGALLGVAVSKCEGFLEDLLPGITEEYHKADARNRSHDATPSTRTVH